MNYKYILLLILIFIISCNKDKKLDDIVKTNSVVKTNKIPIKKEKRLYTIIRFYYKPFEIYSNKSITIEYRSNKITTNIEYWSITNGGDNNRIWVMKNKSAKKYFNISNECKYTTNDIDLSKWSGPKDAEDVKSFNELDRITTGHMFLENHKNDWYTIKWRDKYTNYKLGDKVSLTNY